MTAKTTKPKTEPCISRPAAAPVGTAAAVELVAEPEPAPVVDEPVVEEPVVEEPVVVEETLAARPEVLEAEPPLTGSTLEKVDMAAVELPLIVGVTRVLDEKLVGTGLKVGHLWVRVVPDSPGMTTPPEEAASTEDEAPAPRVVVGAPRLRVVGPVHSMVEEKAGVSPAEPTAVPTSPTEVVVSQTV